jgi:hypothetical protein
MGEKKGCFEIKESWPMEEPTRSREKRKQAESDLMAVV